MIEMDLTGFSRWLPPGADAGGQIRTAKGCATGILVDTGIYKAGYYSISELRNPLGIIPKGPLVGFSAPPGRDGV